jgi:signal transduction histidine kinase
VRAWHEAKQLWVAVADTGPGIAPEDVPHVFDRFWRADRSRDRVSGGTGIGLTICRRLIELHGGHIEVESTRWVRAASSGLICPSPQRSPRRRLPHFTKKPCNL